MTCLNNISIDKYFEFSKIHEKLTRKITEINAYESSVEEINSLTEIYLLSFSDLISIVDKDISIILNVIYCGLKTSFETYIKKIDSIPDYVIQINKLTKKSNDLQEQLKKAMENIKENSTTIMIQEEKLRNSNFELNNLRKELLLHKERELQKI